MAITRTPILDDSGAGTDGTVIDNAWKQEFYNQIDAALGGGPVLQTWTPVDGSGAGLTLQVLNARYTIAGQVLNLHGHIIYPSTANGAAAKIGGLPVAANAYGGFYLVFGVPTLFMISPGATAAGLFVPSSQAAYANSQLSGAQLIFSGSYLIA